MPALDDPVITLLSTHHGAASRAQLLAVGLSRHQIDRLVANRLLLVYTRGVYRAALAPTTPEQAMALACAAAPDVAVSMFSAGRLWNLRRLGHDRRLHVTIAGTAHRTIPGAVIHRSHRTEPMDVVDRPDGIRLTSPPRTAFDLASSLSDSALSSVFEQLLLENVCTVPKLLETARRLSERGRTGSARFQRVLGSRPAWLKPVGSDLELIVERAILEAGLPRPQRQAPVRLPDGCFVHPDFFWPLEREALEIDHITWHGGGRDQYYDKWRDRQLRRVGVRVTRVTDDDIRHRLPAVIDDLRTILLASSAS